MGRQTNNAAVAKQVVLTIHQIQLMAQVEVGPVIAVPGCNVGVQSRFPFPFCTTMTALGISALPPTWSKWKWELMMKSILAGS